MVLFRRIKEPLLLTLISIIILLSVVPGGFPIADAQQPEYGGTVIFALSGDPTPHLMASHSHTVNAYYVGTSIALPLCHYDTNMNWYGDLAESYEVSEDGLRYTFNLFRNVTWHDGEKFTSADVKYTYENLTFLKNPHGLVIGAAVDHIDATDPYKAVFVLKFPFPPLMKYLYFPICPKHIYEGTDVDQNPNNWAPIGTGPFKFVEYVRGSHIILEKNPDYFLTNKPYLDKIIWQIIPDPTTRKVALIKGEIDGMLWISMKVPDIPEYNLDSDLKVVIQPQDLPSMWGGIYRMTLNVRSGPLSDVLVRRAMAHAIDKEFIFKAAVWEIGLIAKGPISAAWPEYNPSLDAMQYEYNETKAEQLLDQAGYPRGDDGWRFTLSFPKGTTITERTKIDDIVIDQLKAVGINVETPILESLALSERITQWDFNITGAGLTSGPSPIVNIPRLYATENIKHVSSSNIGGWSNETFDQITTLAKLEPDPDKVLSYLHEMQEILVSELPAIFIWEYPYPSVFKKEIHGIPPGPQQYEPWTDVWIESGGPILPVTPPEGWDELVDLVGTLSEELTTTTGMISGLETTIENLNSKLSMTTNISYGLVVAIVLAFVAIYYNRIAK